jgi:hypothetical protein
MFRIPATGQAITSGSHLGMTTPAGISGTARKRAAFAIAMSIEVTVMMLLSAIEGIPRAKIKAFSTSHHQKRKHSSRSAFPAKDDLAVVVIALVVLEPPFVGLPGFLAVVALIPVVLPPRPLPVIPLLVFPLLINSLLVSPLLICPLLIRPQLVNPPLIFPVLIVA